MLAVICGSLHVADQMILGSFQNFQSTLERYVMSYCLSNYFFIVGKLSFWEFDDSFHC